MTHDSRWTLEEVKKLISWYNADKSLDEISTLLDRSIAAVSNRISELRRQGALPKRTRERRGCYNAKWNKATRRKPEPAGDAKRRRCLMCGFGFNSTGPENRICPKCKTTAAYNSTTLFDY